MTKEQAYSSSLSYYLDVAIAHAEQQRREGTPATPMVVTSSVSGTVLYTVWAVLSRSLRRNAPTLLVASLPLLALVLGTLLDALGQSSQSHLPALVMLLGLALFLPWQTWQTVRQARELPPYRLRRLFRWRTVSGRYDNWYDLPTMGEMVGAFVVGLLDVPGVLIQAFPSAPSFAANLPSFIFPVLIAMPVLAIVLMAVARGFLAVYFAPSAVKAVDEQGEGMLQSVPLASLPLASLDERITRLTQMREWLQDDTLRTMVDDVIGQQVRAAARRQVAYSFIVGVISLVAGWLLSAISPVATLANLLHR
ncbi:MAG TPA: hypothetical protein VF040_00820 [Ktedonobacterales bacterium]